MPTHNDQPISSDELSDISDTADLGNEVPIHERNYLALLSQVRTGPGAEEFVQSVVQQTVLSSNCDWGALLGSAPKALCYMGQCFVIASSRIAASLQLPDTAGMGARSLRANLVQCSDLGRSAFREAEAKMGKVSMIAQAICEQNGTIDKILAAIEDDSLAEIKLLPQLQKLEKVSKTCVDDTNAIKEKVAAWRDFAVKIHLACEDQNQKAASDERRLEKETEIKSHAMELKKKEVTESEKQTKEYSSRMMARKREYDDGAKALDRTTWSDLGMMAAEIGMKTVSAMYAPVLGLSHFWSASSSASKVPEIADHDTKDPALNSDEEEEYDDNDEGYRLAHKVNPLLQKFQALLFPGGDLAEDHGIEFSRLSESSGNPEQSVEYITRTLRDYSTGSRKTPTQISMKVQEIVEPVIEIGDKIIKIMQEQSNTLGSQHMFSLDDGRLTDWKNCAQIAVKKNCNLLSQHNKKSKKKSSKSHRGRTHGNSKLGIRFERYQQAQEALFQAEEMLSKRMDAERQANEEFDRVQLELMRLSDEKMNVGKVKNILQKCISNLEQFTRRLDDLNNFFTQTHQLIEHIHDYRVDELITGATNAQKILDRSSPNLRDAYKLQLVDSLRVDALKLRGYYLVAQVMADTYVDISSKHIIPGINQVDRLSITDDSEGSQASLRNKLEAVLASAQKAQDEIQMFARKRKQDILGQLVVERGDAQEVKELEEVVAEIQL